MEKHDQKYEAPRLDVVGTLQEITKAGTVLNKDTPNGNANTAYS